MFSISGSYFSVLGILISWNVKKMARYFLRDTWYICLDDLSFQEPKVYPRLLLISFDGDLKPISQATQHMYQGTYFKIMYIQNDSQGLIHVLRASKKYSMNAFLKTVKANQSYVTIF